MTRPFDKGRVFCFVIVLEGNASENALPGRWADEDNSGVITPFGYIEKKCSYIPKVSKFSGYYMEIFCIYPNIAKIQCLSEKIGYGNAFFCYIPKMMKRAETLQLM